MATVKGEPPVSGWEKEGSISKEPSGTLEIAGKEKTVTPKTEEPTPEVVRQVLEPRGMKHIPPMKKLPELPVETQPLKETSLENLDLKTLEDLEKKTDAALRTNAGIARENQTIGTEKTVATIQGNLDLIRAKIFQKAVEAAEPLLQQEGTKLRLVEGALQSQSRSWVYGVIGFGGFAGKSQEAKEAVLKLLEGLKKAQTEEEKDTANTILEQLKSNQWFQSVMKQHESVEREVNNLPQFLLADKARLERQVGDLEKAVNDFVGTTQRPLLSMHRNAKESDIGKKEASLRGLETFFEQALPLVMSAQDDESLLKKLKLSFLNLTTSGRFLSVAKSHPAAASKVEALGKQVGLLLKTFGAFDKRLEEANDIAGIMALRKEIDALDDDFIARKTSLRQITEQKLEEQVLPAVVQGFLQNANKAETLRELSQVQETFAHLRDELSVFGKGVQDKLLLSQEEIDRKAKALLGSRLRMVREKLPTEIAATLMPQVGTLPKKVNPQEAAQGAVTQGWRPLSKREGPVIKPPSPESQLEKREKLEAVRDELRGILREASLFPSVTDDTAMVLLGIENILVGSIYGDLLGEIRDIIASNMSPEKQAADLKAKLEKAPLQVLLDKEKEISKMQEEERKPILQKVLIEVMTNTPHARAFFLQGLSETKRKQLYQTLGAEKLLTGDWEKAFKTENIRRSLLLAIDEDFCKNAIDQEPENKEIFEQTAKYASLALSSYASLGEIVDVLQSIIEKSPPPPFEKIKTFIQNWVELHKGDTNFEAVQKRVLTLGKLPLSSERPPSLPLQQENIPPIPEPDILKKIPDLVGDDRKKAIETVSSEITSVMGSLFLKWNPTFLVTTKDLDKAGFEITDFFNALGPVIKENILGTEGNEGNAEPAIKASRFWLEVGEKCLEKGDISSAMAIKLALQSTEISRLYTKNKKLADAVESFGKFKAPKSKEILDIFNPISSYKGLRAHLRMHASEGVIPFLAMYSGDITFIKDGNLEKGSLSPRVYFAGRAVDELREHQKRLKQRDLPQPTTRLYDWMTQRKGEIEKQDKNYLYNRSYLVRPRAASV